MTDIGTFMGMKIVASVADTSDGFAIVSPVKRNGQLAYYCIGWHPKYGVREATVDARDLKPAAAALAVTAIQPHQRYAGSPERYPLPAPPPAKASS